MQIFATHFFMFVYENEKEEDKKKEPRDDEKVVKSRLGKRKCNSTMYPYFKHFAICAHFAGKMTHFYHCNGRYPESVF